MARMSIYVPDALKATMDEFGDANWSGVAQRAFEDEINQQSWRKDGTMETAIERLRASKAAYVQATVGDGKDTGRHWAMTSAEYSELRRLASLDDDTISEITELALKEGSKNGLRDVVNFHMREVNTEPYPFFSGLYFSGEDWAIDNEEWVAAFVEGAREVWLEVKDKL